MEKALATFRNGQVQFDAAVDWPEGTRLEVAPAATKAKAAEPIEDLAGSAIASEPKTVFELSWPETPEQKADWLEWLKNLEPFDMTPEELDAFEANLKVSKEIQKELLRKTWQEEKGL